MSDVTKKIIKIIDEVSGQRNIMTTSNLERDLHMDSLDNVEACMMMEEEFNIVVTDEDAEH